MGTFAYSDDDRERWAKSAAAVLAIQGAVLRKRMAARIGTDLPSDPGAVWSPAWWQSGLDGPVSTRFTQIAGDAAGTFHEGAGWGPIDDVVRAEIARSVADEMIAVMGGRGDIVANRITELLTDGLETNLAIESGESRATVRDGDWLKRQLELISGDGGPLSDRLMDDFGASAVTTLAMGAAASLLDRYNVDARREWHCSFLPHSRDAHLIANGQPAEPGEPFIVGGESGYFPGDIANLSEWNTVNCQCYLSYDLPDRVPLAAIGGGLVSEDMSDEFTITGASEGASFAAPLLAMTMDVVRNTFDVVPGDDDHDYSDRACITVEPTPAEKQLLAVEGGTPAENLHVTLVDLGLITDLGDGARLVIGSVLAQVAESTAPFGGDVTGIGWFGDVNSITLALIDGDGLAALRTRVVDEITAAGVPISTDHDFVPHSTLAWAQVDAADKVGLPLHFNEIRLRFGTEVIAFDLMGPIETAPESPVVEPETAPEVPDSTPEIAPSAPATEASMTVTTFDDIPAVDDAPIPEDVGVPPEDLSAIPDDILATELARRAADRVLAENEAVTGEESDADTVAAVHSAADEEAAGVPNDLEEAIAEEAGLDEDPDDEVVEDPDVVEAVAPVDVPYNAGGVVLHATSSGTTNSSSTTITWDQSKFRVIRSPFSATPPGAPNGADAVSPESSHDAAEDPGQMSLLDPGVPFAVMAGVPPAPDGVEMDWQAVLCVEGIMSGDQRMIGEGATVWRQLPVPLAFVSKITSAHQEGEFAGWVHQIWRDGAAICGAGTFADNEAGNEIKDILNDPKGANRFGVSVDMDDCTSVYADEAGTVLDPMEAQDAYYAGDKVVEMMVACRLIGLTCVMHPAFQEANIWLEPVDSPALVASGGVEIHPLWKSYRSHAFELFGADMPAIVASACGTDVPAPPKSLFELRPMEYPEPFTVGAPLEDGTIPCYGLLAEKGTFHIGMGKKKVAVPMCDDFRSFYTGKKMLTAEGELLSVGPIVMDTVHPNLYWDASASQDFYAHTGATVGAVKLHRNEWGIVAAGVILPDATPAQVNRLRVSDVSPDWRPMYDKSGRREHKIICVLGVPVSGFLVEGIAASAGRMQPWVAFDDDGEMMGLVAAGAIMKERPRTVRELTNELAETQAHMAALSDYMKTIGAHVNREQAQKALDRLGIDGPLKASRRRSAQHALRVLGLPAAS